MKKKSQASVSRQRKSRADQLLVQQGLVATRERGKRLIMAGQVFASEACKTEQQILKPGTFLPEDVVLQVKGQERFVSRGGGKLLTA